MLALARLTLKGPFQAASVVGILAVLAVFLPLIAPNNPFGVMFASVSMLLSCILVGLIILTQGSGPGLRAIGTAVVGITAVAWALVNAPQLGLWTAAVQWLPIILLAQTLRSTHSLALTMLVGVAVGAIGVGTQYLFWGDLETELMRQVLGRMEQLEQVPEEVVKRNIELVRLFVLALVAMAYLIAMLIVLAARHLQARIAESKAFGDEFRALALGKPAAATALVLLLASFWVPQPWFSSIAFLLVIAFIFQGIAVVHQKLQGRRQARFMLGAFYALLLIFPQVIALTAVTGMVDNWLVFRKRPVKPDEDNEL